jgi:hypothetical protein
MDSSEIRNCRKLPECLPLSGREEHRLRRDGRQRTDDL